MTFRRRFTPPPPPAGGLLVGVEAGSRKGTTLLRFEGGVTTVLRLSAATAEGLRPGRTLDDAALAPLLDEDERIRARDTAIRMLARYPRNQRDLERRLARRGYGPGAIVATVERLLAVGLIDDQVFAEHFVASRTARHHSRRLIGLELGRLGVSEPVSAAATAGVDDEAAATDAALRRATRLRDLGRDEFYRRLGGFLQRRGFGYETSRRALDVAWRSVTADEDTPGLDVSWQ